MCALCNVCANSKGNKQRAREAGALPELVRLLSSSQNTEVLSPLAGTICNLAMDCADNRAELIRLGAPDILRTLGLVLHCNNACETAKSGRSHGRQIHMNTAQKKTVAFCLGSPLCVILIPASLYISSHVVRCSAAKQCPGSVPAAGSGPKSENWCHIFRRSGQVHPARWYLLTLIHQQLSRGNYRALSGNHILLMHAVSNTHMSR